MVNPDEIYEIEDYSAQTLQAQIERLLVGNTPEQLIYRECELDELWRLLDLDITSLRAAGGSATELARLQRARDIVMQAHDLVGVDGNPAAAAERLRELIG
jgi:hypothetical protein